MQAAEKQGIVREQSVDGRVVDVLGVELLVDPTVESHLANRLDVAGAGAEGEAVEGVDDLLVGGLFAV